MQGGGVLEEFGGADEPEWLVQDVLCDDGQVGAREALGLLDKGLQVIRLEAVTHALQLGRHHHGPSLSVWQRNVDSLQHTKITVTNAVLLSSLIPSAYSDQIALMADNCFE